MTKKIDLEEFRKTFNSVRKIFDDQLLPVIVETIEKYNQKVEEDKIELEPLPKEVPRFLNQKLGPSQAKGIWANLLGRFGTPKQKSIWPGFDEVLKRMFQEWETSSETDMARFVVRHIEQTYYFPEKTKEEFTCVGSLAEDLAKCNWIEKTENCTTYKYDKLAQYIIDKFKTPNLYWWETCEEFFANGTKRFVDGITYHKNGDIYLIDKGGIRFHLRACKPCTNPTIIDEVKSLLGPDRFELLMLELKKMFV